MPACLRSRPGRGISQGRPRAGGVSNPVHGPEPDQRLVHQRIAAIPDRDKTPDPPPSHRWWLRRCGRLGKIIILHRIPPARTLRMVSIVIVSRAFAGTSSLPTRRA
jgi:hypothetical protein